MTKLLIASLALLLSACAAPTTPTASAVTLTLHVIDGQNTNPVRDVIASPRRGDDGSSLPTVTAPNGIVSLSLPADTAVWIDISAPGYLAGSLPVRLTANATQTVTLGR